MPDQILYTISTVGRISLDEFYSAYDEIQALGTENKGIDIGDNFRKTRSKTIRLIEALGHCEFDFENRLVYACPPVLVALPSSGLPNAVLTGARTPSMINKMVEFISCNKDSISLRCIKQGTKEYLLPSAIFIEAVDQSALASVAEAANIGHKLDVPAAWYFANFSMGIEDVKNCLFFEEKTDLNWYKETFSSEVFNFSKYYNKDPPQGLVWYTNPYNQQPYHLIWKAGCAAKVDRYWGSYIILADDNVKVLLYDSRRNLLAVPSRVPLPGLLGRAAALCSGLSPEPIILDEPPTKDLPTGLSIEVYCAVPPSIARLISKKLAQDIIPCEIKLNET